MIHQNAGLHRRVVRSADEISTPCRLHLRLRAFRRNEAGATSVEFVVVTAMVVSLAAAIAAGVATGAQKGAERIEKCMEIQGKLIRKDISYEKQLKRIQKRCAKL